MEQYNDIKKDCKIELIYDELVDVTLHFSSHPKQYIQTMYCKVTHLPTSITIEEYGHESRKLVNKALERINNMINNP